jgi:hypothetical protein
MGRWVPPTSGLSVFVVVLPCLSGKFEVSQVLFELRHELIYLRLDVRVLRKHSASNLYRATAFISSL